MHSVDQQESISLDGIGSCERPEEFPRRIYLLWSQFYPNGILGIVCHPVSVSFLGLGLVCVYAMYSWRILLMGHVRKLDVIHLRSLLKHFLLLQLLKIKEELFISKCSRGLNINRNRYSLVHLQYIYDTAIERWENTAVPTIWRGGCCIVSNSALKQWATRGCFLKLLDQFYLAIAYSSLHKARCSLEFKVSSPSQNAGKQRAIHTQSEHVIHCNSIQLM